jgi:hypothetical protein
MKRLMTRPVLRRLGGLAALLVVATLAASTAGGAGRGDGDIQAHAENTAESLRSAKSAGAAERAPLTLALAEDAYALGLLLRRRQELRPAFLRGDARAIEAFEAARVHSDAAKAVASSANIRARTLAEFRLTSLSSLLNAMDAVDETVWIEAGSRIRLLRARQLSADAFALLGSGMFDAAVERADRATDDARAVAAALAAVTGRFKDAGRIEAWEGWADETIAWSSRTGKPAIIIDKDAHTVVLYERGRVAKRYQAELGWNNIGDKRQHGDGATPEGRYFVTQAKSVGRSRYHAALLIDYPNAADRRALEELKRTGAVARGAGAGSLIEIHGQGGQGRDWTDGCIAVTNLEVEELIRRAPVGTPVTIVGSLTGAGTFSQMSDRLGAAR